MHNLLTDVAGIAVGHATDLGLASGATAILFDEMAVASGVVLGGAPGTRDTRLLEPEATVPGVNAFVLSGGSAFGLDAAGGVQAWLRAQGRGWRLRDAVIPVVSQAILFDLLKATDNTGITLTESQAMLPTAAVSGFYFAHPDSQYFGVARIGRDQLEDYAARRGIDLAVAERWLRPNLD